MEGTDASPTSSETEPQNDQRTLIEKMFGGTLVTGIRCLRCNCISEKEEPFTDLSLAFCPSVTSQDSPQTNGPSQPKVLCQGSVNGGSETLEPGSAKSPVSNIHTVPVSKEPPLSVPDLINYFLAPEILDEDNAYFCEQCSSLHRAERTMKVVSAPEYLILTLLRFSYDAKSHVRRKILESVTIPPLMRLPVHAHSHPMQASSSDLSPPPKNSPESSENLAKKLKPCKRDDEENKETTGKIEQTNRMGETSVQSVLYGLSSVVVHSGVSSESGHYYSYGRNINGADGAQHPANHFAFKGDLQNGQDECTLSTCSALSISLEQGETQANGSQEARDWLLFNDSRVTFSSFQLVQNITNRFPKDTAYVLMYRKQEVPEQSRHGGQEANRVRLSAEPPLQKELLDAIIKDNKLYLQVCLCGNKTCCFHTKALCCKLY